MPDLLQQKPKAAGAPVPVEPAPAAPDAHRRAPTREPDQQVRAADLEPYVGLKYLSRLFKLMAVVVVILMLSEIVTGLGTDGMEALPRLLSEVSQFVVFAALLWGSGDVAILLIDMGHDLRASRILLGRQLAHHTEEHHATIDPTVAAPLQSEQL